MKPDASLHRMERAYTHIDVWIEELGPCVASQHVDDDYLSPLLHINQEVTQLPVVFMDQVNALWTHLLKSHDDTPCHQLQHMFSHTADYVRTLVLRNTTHTF